MALNQRVISFYNKRIWIIGASSGIGAETARLARFQGAHVIGLDRNDPMITLDGFIKIDMGDTASIDAAVAALPSRVDALINAAGVSGLADKDLVARVNYLGLRHLTEALVRDVQAFASQGFAAFVQRFSQLDALQGEAVQLSDGTRGTACGVNSDGALQVLTERGMQTVSSAEVSVRPC